MPANPVLTPERFQAEADASRAARFPPTRSAAAARPAPPPHRSPRGFRPSRAG